MKPPLVASAAIRVLMLVSVVAFALGCDAFRPAPVAPGTFTLAARGDAAADLRGTARLEVDSTAGLDPDRGVYLTRYSVQLDGGEAGGAQILLDGPLRAQTLRLTPTGGQPVAFTVAGTTFVGQRGTLTIARSDEGGYDGTFDVQGRFGGNPLGGIAPDVATARARFRLDGAD